MDKIIIKRLYSGGIIPIYKCPAACRHCMYGCSNFRDGSYIDNIQSKKLCENLKKLGANTLHIGGGEPFLNFNRLLDLINNMNENNLTVDYIETNAAWVSKKLTDEQIINMLKNLKQINANCLLISIDPYHAEFVELYKPLRLIKLCNEAAMDYFIWKQEYIKPLSNLDINKKYNRKELEEILGKDYVYTTAKSYNLGYNGRALNIQREYTLKKPVDEFINNSNNCNELLNVHHYHADLNNMLIPPGCIGIAVDLDDIKNITYEMYPVFYTLATKGIKGLLLYALECGFNIDTEGYTSKCDLCFNIRKYLSSNKKTKDIYPKDFYESDF